MMMTTIMMISGFSIVFLASAWWETLGS